MCFVVLVCVVVMVVTVVVLRSDGVIITGRVDFCCFVSLVVSGVTVLVIVVTVVAVVQVLIGVMRTTNLYGGHYLWCYSVWCQWRCGRGDEMPVVTVVVKQDNVVQ